MAITQTVPARTWGLAIALVAVACSSGSSTSNGTGGASATGGQAGSSAGANASGGSAGSTASGGVAGAGPLTPACPVCGNPWFTCASPGAESVNFQVEAQTASGCSGHIVQFGGKTDAYTIKCAPPQVCGPNGCVSASLTDTTFSWGNSHCFATPK